MELTPQLIVELGLGAFAVALAALFAIVFTIRLAWLLALKAACSIH